MVCKEPRIIELSKICDPRGNLSVIEGNADVPFDIKRTYWIYDVPGGMSRFGHAFKKQEEFIVALSGSLMWFLTMAKRKSDTTCHAHTTDCMCRQ